MSYTKYYAQSSGAGAISESKGSLASITLTSDAAASYVDLRDSTGSGGSKRITPANCPTNDTVSVPLHGYTVTNGVYVESFTGTDSELTLVYE